MPGGWRLNCRRVPVPPVPTREPDRTVEIQRRRQYLPPDLRADPAYAIDSESWCTYLSTERGRSRRAGFMDDRDFPFHRAQPTRPRRQQAATRHDRASTRAQYNDDDDDNYDDDDYIEALAYHNELYIWRGIDYNDVFSPVVKHSSIRAFFGIVAMRDLEFEQLDVKTAFLHGELEEEIYRDQPEGFVVSGKEDLICKLKRSLYGLKQSPRQWYKSQSAIYLTKDKMFHEKTKDIDIKYHYVRDIVAKGRGPLVGGLGGGSRAPLDSGTTGDEVVVSHADGGCMGGGGLQGETLCPVLLASWRPALVGWRCGCGVAQA
ncbi:hypothetical protein QYE76_062510 [Lolium multiflorum]|uniref:Reverse transcriptase Ty1/copia-type domain-containing protein n=1 Tax=Lolium multiflorum TaxID=4521 RepID=A0AAD8W7B7_LOLMU|nr:hypothetical protein QYE76_062510 [Lolium multiflorum]